MSRKRHNMRPRLPRGSTWGSSRPDRQRSCTVAGVNAPEQLCFSFGPGPRPDLRAGLTPMTPDPSPCSPSSRLHSPAP